MNSSTDDPAVEQDEDGRLWLDLRATRRQTLAGLGSAIAAGLGIASGQSQQTVGGDVAHVGDGYVVPSHELAQAGTLQELYVGRFEADFPPVHREPSIRIALEGGPWVAASDGGSSTNTILTNLAEVHVIDGDASSATVQDAPALIFATTGGPLLVLDGAPHQRSGLGGTAAELHGADVTSNLPSSAPAPSLGYARDVAGDDPNPGVYV